MSASRRLSGVCFQRTSLKLDINDFKQCFEGFGWAAALVWLCNSSLHPSLPESEHWSSESGCQKLEGWESLDYNRFALPQLPWVLLCLQRTGNSICQVFKVSISLPIPGSYSKAISLAQQTYIAYTLVWIKWSSTHYVI